MYSARFQLELEVRPHEGERGKNHLHSQEVITAIVDKIISVCNPEGG